MKLQPARPVTRPLRERATSNSYPNHLVLTASNGVNEVLSLFGVSLKQHASVSQNTRQVAVSLIGAFLVVIAAGFALNIASASIDAAARPQTNEPVAYQPGQYIKAELSRGYVGVNQ